jgi:hypothetical protein
MIRLKKVKAGALQLTMFMVVVIALMLAAFIILVSTHKRFNIQTDFVLETINNANRGIDYVLGNDVGLNDTLSIDMDNRDFIELKVHRDYWGLFEKVMAISQVKNHGFRKMALVGASQPDKDRIALYIEDQNRPFVVVGNTKIRGMAYVPKEGVRTGNISGHSYYGSQLIYGETRPSGELPKLLDETLEQIKTIFSRMEHVDANRFLDVNKVKIHQNSFFSPLQVLYSQTDMSLSGVSLTGHIMVYSETKIIVDTSATLKDVILIAPIIEIKAGSHGAFQAFASKAITIGEHSNFGYPSAFVLMEETKYNQSNESIANETPLVKVGKGTSIKGVIAYLGDSKNYMAQVFVDEDVMVTGEIYCNKNLELLGTVYGSVFASGFMANQSGSSYQNHLYNATISVDDLAQEYVGLSFENSKKDVIKWLY